MLTTLTLHKAIGKQAKTQLTLFEAYRLLKGQGLSWSRTELAFLPDGMRAHSVKSLKAIAKQTAFLQPYYRQRVRDQAATQATGGWPLVWKIQDFAEAMADKSKAISYPQIEWTLPEAAPDFEEALQAIDTILATYPQKNYQYKFQAHFIGLPLGDDSLLELPADYASGRGPVIADESNDVLRTKWAHSHVRFGRDKYGSSVLTHCLLDESYNAPDKQSALPEAFVSLAKSLHEFKAKDVKRRVIYSVQESDDDYAKLTPELRLELDRRIAVHVIGLERALYRELTGSDFPAPPPATQDDAETRAYIIAISRATNQAYAQANQLPNRPYSINKLRQVGAKATLEGRFTSFEALELNPEVSKATAFEDEKPGPDQKQYEQLVSEAIDEARRHLSELNAEGKLPHRLEQYYFPEGVLRVVGKNESGRVIMKSIPNPDPSKTSYAPYHHLWVPEEKPIPPSLEALGYRRDGVRSLFEQLKQLFMASYQNLDHAMGHFKTSHIDGVECFVVATAREKFNRRKIMGAVFKPLGYDFMKQPQGSTGTFELKKPLSDAGSLSCHFDFGTWRQTVECSFSYDGAANSVKRVRPFRMRLTGWSHQASVEISSEELFTKTIENIGAMVAVIEKEHVPRIAHLIDERFGVKP